MKGLVWKKTGEVLPLEGEPVFCKTDKGEVDVAIFCCDDEALYWYRESDRKRLNSDSIVEWARKLIVCQGVM